MESSRVEVCMGGFGWLISVFRFGARCVSGLCQVCGRSKVGLR